jgi:ethanolamine-phosphate cytidylyltransferase
MDRPARSSPFPAFSPLCVRSHVNAFRQGRSLGTHLVVGVNDDESIARCKGAPPVMNDAERLAMVKGCKFVDEVVPNVPYVMSDEYVRWVIKTYNIDFVVHGDDPCIVDGRDVYESAQRLGKYMTIPRTEGVSTTEIVARTARWRRRHRSSR